MTDKEVSQLLTPEEMAEALAPRFLGAKVNRPIRARAWLNEHKRELSFILEAQLAKVLKHYKYDDPEYDPQAEEIGWYLKHGWLPPPEVEKLKEQLKHGLDSPDREKIAELLCNKQNPTPEDNFWSAKASEPYKVGFYFIADQILALQGEQSRTLIPDEKEIRKDERQKVEARYDNDYMEIVREEAKREERERILRELVRIPETIKDNKAGALFLAHTRTLRQALKEE